jgi:hypothetical protein
MIRVLNLILLHYTHSAEYSWNQQHGDLGVAHSVKLLLDDGDVAVDPFNETEHGTAVLGEMVGTPNSFGINGISPGAQVGLAPEYTVNLGDFGRSNAILLAVHDAKPGDIILLVSTIISLFQIIKNKKHRPCNFRKCKLQLVETLIHLTVRKMGMALLKIV